LDHYGSITLRIVKLLLASPLPASRAGNNGGAFGAGGVKIMKYMLKVALGASLFSSSAMASAESFVVLGDVGANLDAAVAAAGGTVTKRLKGIDAVVAQGGAGFLSAIASKSGVTGAAEDRQINWLPQSDKVEFVDDSAVNPPNNPPGVDSRFNLQWGHTAVKAVDAWHKGYEGQGARVAVLDGGFQLGHPDMAGRFDPTCTADMTGEGIEYTADVFSHGMHTAGTIGAARNGTGTIGVAPRATLCLVKVLFNSGSGTFEDVAEGIIYAADKNVDVISMSLGGSIPKSAPGASVLRELVDRAVSYAYKSGALVITSAGNDGESADSPTFTGTAADLIHLPSDSPQAISISATAPHGWAKDPNNTFLDNPASYTNYGRSVINLAAPGGDRLASVTGNCTIAGLTRACNVFDLVFSTGARNSYYWSAGTSMATPHVSGVAALIVSKYGKMHPAKLRAYLNGGADDLGVAGHDQYYGNGRVNALRSVSK
jgi:subtilisin family serine protease